MVAAPLKRIDVSTGKEEAEKKIWKRRKLNYDCDRKGAEPIA
jgi:hypothetical protein